MDAKARWIPRLTYGVAAAHLAVGARHHRAALREMLADGLVGSAGDDGPRDRAVWFLLAGPAVASLGALAQWGVQRTGELPRPLGVALLGLGGTIVLVDPASGGWALLGLGAAAWRSGRGPGPGSCGYRAS